MVVKLFAERLEERNLWKPKEGKVVNGESESQFFSGLVLTRMIQTNCLISRATIIPSSA